MSDCKHGNLWCNGTVKFRTTGPCLQCLRDLFKDRDEARQENAKLREDRDEIISMRDAAEMHVIRLRAELAALRAAPRKHAEWRNNTTPEELPYRVEQQEPAEVTQGEWKVVK